MLFLMSFFALGLMAQSKKNQVRIGYRGSDLLGDNRGYSSHNFWRYIGTNFELPTWDVVPNIEYRRKIKEKHLLGLEYGFWQNLAYTEVNNIPDNTLLYRQFRSVEFLYGYELLNSGRLSISAIADVGYRFDAFEVIHERYFLSHRVWLYPYHPNAFSLGLSTDLMFRLKWGLFLHGKVGYHRYFSEYAPNELRVVLGAGWEF